MWRRRSEREWRKAELLGRFSEQDSYSVFVLRTQHAHINCLCPGSLQLSLRLLDIDFRSNAALKVIDGQIRVHAQINRREVRRTRLRLLSIGLHVFSNSPPDVGLIGNVEWQHEVVVGGATQD